MLSSKFPSEQTRPAELFVGRELELGLIEEVLSPVQTKDLGSTRFLTTFYGVGGTGKSRLCEEGLERGVTGSSKEHLVCVYVDFDNNDWNPKSYRCSVAGALCKALLRKRVPCLLTQALLALTPVEIKKRGKSDMLGDFGGPEFADAALDIMEGIEMASGVFKAGMLGWDKWQKNKQSKRLRALGLWPTKIQEQINLDDLRDKLEDSLVHDVLDYLTQNQTKRVCLFIDGYEKIQSRDGIDQSAQWYLHQFLYKLANRLAKSDDEDRFRALVFGRNKLEWGEIYQKCDWSRHMDEHPLGGFTKKEATVFLRNCEKLYKKQGLESFADYMSKYRTAIFDASDEMVNGQRFFHPFHLNLAVDKSRRSHDTVPGLPPDLGSTPDELEERFLRNLDGESRRALQILALTETFDTNLFDWLVDERLISFARHTFHSQLRQGDSYFQLVDESKDEWRFHGKMQSSLYASWQRLYDKKEAKAVIVDLLAYYARPLLGKSEDVWGGEEFRNWRRGMEIIVTNGPEGGGDSFLSYSDWSDLLNNEPWCTSEWIVQEERYQFLKRIHIALENYIDKANSTQKKWLYCALIESAECAAELSISSLDEASGFYRLALKHMPDGTLEKRDVHLSLCECLHLAGNVDAVSGYLEALQAVSDNERAHIALGKNSDSVGKAARYFMKCITSQESLSPSDVSGMAECFGSGVEPGFFRVPVGERPLTAYDADFLEKFHASRVLSGCLSVLSDHGFFIDHQTGVKDEVGSCLGALLSRGALLFLSDAILFTNIAPDSEELTQCIDVINRSVSFYEDIENSGMCLHLCFFRFDCLELGRGLMTEETLESFSSLYGYMACKDGASLEGDFNVVIMRISDAIKEELREDDQAADVLSRIFVSVFKGEFHEEEINKYKLIRDRHMTMSWGVYDSTTVIYKIIDGMIDDACVVTKTTNGE